VWTARLECSKARPLSGKFIFQCRAGISKRRAIMFRGIKILDFRRIRVRLPTGEAHRQGDVSSDRTTGQDMITKVFKQGPGMSRMA